jgi:hypothetical protein
VVDPPVARGPLAFACPRCTADVEEAYYGPCPTCRGDLVRTLGSEARAVETADYVPKMNVTPNAVAQKD